MGNAGLNRTLQELWQARHFIRNSIRNEFITRVIRSRLGIFWIILYPLAQVAIYAFVLSAVMAAKLPGMDGAYAYPIYLTAGILAWTLFAEVLSRCQNIFIENGNLLKKMVFPRLALPLVVAGSALLNNIILLICALLIFGLLGHFSGLVLFWLLPLTLLLLLLALGYGLALGLLNVFIRDISQFVTIVLQFGFWLTPVVYSASLIPERYRVLLHLNPMTGIVQAYQSVLVYARAPDLSLLVYPVACALAGLLLACVLYRRAIDEVVDVL